jgi:putative Holliday junction resolvase
MKVLGLDIGDRRIGVAVSDEEMSIARPLAVIDRNNDDSAIEEISETIKEQDVKVVVYGNPLSLSGSSGRQAEMTSRFAERIGEAVGVPVIPQDERLSSAEAEKALIAQGLKREKRRAVIDKVAAAIILQAYLDGRHG